MFLARSGLAFSWRKDPCSSYFRSKPSGNLLERMKLRAYELLMQLAYLQMGLNKCQEYGGTSWSEAARLQRKSRAKQLETLTACCRNPAASLRTLTTIRSVVACGLMPSTARWRLLPILFEDAGRLPARISWFRGDVLSSPPGRGRWTNFAGGC